MYFPDHDAVRFTLIKKLRKKKKKRILKCVVPEGYMELIKYQKQVSLLLDFHFSSKSSAS